jgi:GAF domain-containing protein
MEAAPALPAQAQRASGDELIADLFQEMHELDFCSDSREAAAFTLALAMEKLGTGAGMVHLYDIDQREFVVVQAAGPGAAILRDLRTAEADPLAAEALRTRGAVIVREPAADPRASGQRWAALRNAMGQPIASIASARAAQAGRFLGLIELVHPAGGASFAAGDDHALSYIAERFTEFVAAHGVMLGEES